jgi:site-specific DNA-methyltransferase (adenine-specific)
MIKISDTEYFSNDRSIRFLNMDCNEFMAGLKDNEFDLIHNDPPYGLGKSVVNSGGRFKRYKNKNGNWDMNTPDTNHFNLCFKVSNNQIIWGGNYFSLPTNKHFIIWDKIQPQGISFAMCEYAWSSLDKVAQIYSERTQGQEQRFHPTQKPIDLYRWILQNYTKPTDTILDCFGGSMSHAIAAHMERRNLTIIELDKDYFKRSLERFRIYESQLTLF